MSKRPHDGPHHANQVTGGFGKNTNWTRDLTDADLAARVEYAREAGLPRLIGALRDEQRRRGLL